MTKVAEPSRRAHDDGVDATPTEARWYCPFTGLLQHATATDARRAARRMEADHRVYQCDQCGRFHVVPVEEEPEGSREPRSRIPVGTFWGRWQVIRHATPGQREGGLRARVEARCACGTTQKVFEKDLKHGRSSGCRSAECRHRYRAGKELGRRVEAHLRQVFEQVQADVETMVDDYIEDLRDAEGEP